MDCLFCNIKDSKDSTYVRDFGNWILRVNPYQFLLGVCVLVHKDHKEGLTSLSEEEIVEAHNNLKLVEISLQRSFSPDWFNYLQTNNKIRRLHFHIIPRYKYPVTFRGEEFIDTNYYGMPVESARELPESTMEMLIETIKTSI